MRATLKPLWAAKPGTPAITAACVAPAANIDKVSDASDGASTDDGDASDAASAGDGDASAAASAVDGDASKGTSLLSEQAAGARAEMSANVAQSERAGELHTVDIVNMLFA